jgi:hypothetical protein
LDQQHHATGLDVRPAQNDPRRPWQRAREALRTGEISAWRLAGAKAKAECDQIDMSQPQLSAHKKAPGDA